PRQSAALGTRRAPGGQAQENADREHRHSPDAPTRILDRQRGKERHRVTVNHFQTPKKPAREPARPTLLPRALIIPLLDKARPSRRACPCSIGTAEGVCPNELEERQ